MTYFCILTGIILAAAIFAYFAHKDGYTKDAMENQINKI